MTVSEMCREYGFESVVINELGSLEFTYVFSKDDFRYAVDVVTMSSPNTISLTAEEEICMEVINAYKEYQGAGCSFATMIIDKGFNLSAKHDPSTGYIEYCFQKGLFKTYKLYDAVGKDVKHTVKNRLESEICKSVLKEYKQYKKRWEESNNGY